MFYLLTILYQKQTYSVWKTRLSGRRSMLRFEKKSFSNDNIQRRAEKLPQPWRTSSKLPQQRTSIQDQGNDLATE